MYNSTKPIIFLSVLSVGFFIYFLCHILSKILITSLVASLVWVLYEYRAFNGDHDDSLLCTNSN